MTTNAPDTTITQIQAFRLDRHDADEWFDMSDEWALFEYSGLTLLDLFLQPHAIQAINSSPAEILSQNLKQRDLLQREGNLLTAADVGIPPRLFVSRPWGDQGFLSDPAEMPRGSTEYLEAVKILNGYFGAYGHRAMDAVRRFEQLSWRPELCRLLSGLALATNGEYRPVVAINEDDQAFELEARLNGTSELFFEVDSDGQMEVVLRSDQRGVEEIEVQSISELLEIIRHEVSASSL